MIEVSEFEKDFAVLLPETHGLLVSANLVVHPAVSRITLHGSRGPAGGCRPESDVDLCLVVDGERLPTGPALDGFLREMLEITLENWKGPIEPDLAAIFDTAGCGLKCFERGTFDRGLCQTGGVDCFGIYKIQKGFDGFVTGVGLQVERMYPCMVIWQNQACEVDGACGVGG